MKHLMSFSQYCKSPNSARIVRQGKILHLCVLDKFIPPFIDFLDKEFADFSSRHVFIIKGGQSCYKLKKRSNIFCYGSSRLERILSCLKISKYIRQADKVFLHGLFDPDIVKILALMPWQAKKCYWVIWGGDLYKYNKKRVKMREHIKEYMRRIVIKRLGHLVTYIKGDYQLAAEWYGAKGEYHECLMYTSNTVNAENLNNIVSSAGANKSLNILIGNSADPSNNHVEVFEKLLPYRDQDIKLFVPLSYGSYNHAKYVEEIGIKWFGSSFFPLLEFMPLSDYQKLLGNIDIAIFNHRRQQAMGNTITLLGLGKKVFLRRGLSQWNFLCGLGVTVFDFNDLNLDKINPSCSRKNKYVVQDYFSGQNLKNQLSSIFS